jgi:hypothetical protein
VLNTITTGTTTTIGTTTAEVMNMNTTMTDTVITTTTIDSTRRCNCSVALAEPVLRFQERGLELFPQRLKPHQLSSSKAWLNPCPDIDQFLLTSDYPIRPSGRLFDCAGKTATIFREK